MDSHHPLIKAFHLPQIKTLQHQRKRNKGRNFERVSTSFTLRVSKMKTMDKWVVEFFLRRQQNPRMFATTLLSALDSLDSSDGSVKLKKTAVLRDISNSLIQGTISEGTLDLLEILEKLLLQEGSVVTECLKSAYCWTAVECTVRFMWPETVSGGLFGDALERIWTKRIGMLQERESGLVSEELLKWESDLEDAYEEPGMYREIRESNVRYVAVSYLNELLEEQWGVLGCSTLELEAQKRLVESRVGDSVGNVSEECEGGNGENREEGSDTEEVGGLEDAVGVGDKVGEEEEEMENEPSLANGGMTVAQELKDWLLEIQGDVDSSTRQEQEPNNEIDQSVDVTPRADQANRTETGGGEDHCEAENADHQDRTESGGDGEHSEAESSQGVSSASSSCGRVRPRLPTPEPLNVTPLKKVTAVPRPRRAMKFWSPEEVEALKEGVKEYGKSWKDIKNSNPAVFAGRTEVDLKDKWRNYMGR